MRTVNTFKDEYQMLDDEKVAQAESGIYWSHVRDVVDDLYRLIGLNARDFPLDDRIQEALDSSEKMIAEKRVEQEKLSGLEGADKKSIKNRLHVINEQARFVEGARKVFSNPKLKSTYDRYLYNRNRFEADKRLTKARHGKYWSWMISATVAAFTALGGVYYNKAYIKPLKAENSKMHREATARGVLSYFSLSLRKVSDKINWFHTTARVNDDSVPSKPNREIEKMYYNRETQDRLENIFKNLEQGYLGAAQDGSKELQEDLNKITKQFGDNGTYIVGRINDMNEVLTEIQNHK